MNCSTECQYPCGKKVIYHMTRNTLNRGKTLTFYRFHMKVCDVCKYSGKTEPKMRFNIPDMKPYSKESRARGTENGTILKDIHMKNLIGKLILHESGIE